VHTQCHAHARKERVCIKNTLRQSASHLIGAITHYESFSCTVYIQRPWLVDAYELGHLQQSSTPKHQLFGFLSGIQPAFHFTALAAAALVPPALFPHRSMTRCWPRAPRQGGPPLGPTPGLQAETVHQPESQPCFPEARQWHRLISTAFALKSYAAWRGEARAIPKS
jgi:hypothetical protein